MPTTIQIQPVTKERLDELKVHPRESYDSVVNRLIECAIDDEPLSDETIAALEEAVADIKAGRVYTHEQVKKELGL